MKKTRCSGCNSTHTAHTIGYFDYCDTCYHNYQIDQQERAQHLTRQQLGDPDNYAFNHDYQK